MQKLVFFIESTDRDCGLAANICNLYMNRFSIDEDAGHEIVKICELDALRFTNHLSVGEKARIGKDQITI